MLTRREFSQMLLATGTAVLAEDVSGATHVLESGRTANPADPNQKCDLLIKGGTVIDPGQQLHAVLDVAVKNGKILEVSKDIPEHRAVKVVTANGRIVTPGFIDLQVHCFEGISNMAMNADHYCLGRGVTTVIENGAAGYMGISGYIKYIVNPSITRIYTSVNIVPIGIVSPDVTKALENPDSMDPVLAARAAIENRPAVVGIKAYPEKRHVGANDLACVRKALEAATLSRLPLVVDIVDTYSPLPEILKMLRKGDVFTHVYCGYQNGVLDGNGKVLPEVLEARDRGVFVDTAQGRDKFSFDVAERCIAQNLLPDAISTDLFAGNVDALVYDLPTTVSKFMALGMSIDQAIERVTLRPSQIFDFGVQIGTLRPGSEADISIFELKEGKFEFFGSSSSDKRYGRQMLVSKAVICRGRFFVNSV